MSNVACPSCKKAFTTRRGSKRHKCHVPASAAVEGPDSDRVECPCCREVLCLRQVNRHLAYLEQPISSGDFGEVGAAFDQAGEGTDLESDDAEEAR